MHAFATTSAAVAIQRMREGAIVLKFDPPASTLDEGAQLDLFYKAGPPDEARDNHGKWMGSLLPAGRHEDEKTVTTAALGQTHGKVLVNARGKGYQGALEYGYLDPKTKQFYTREQLGGVETTDLHPQSETAATIRHLRGTDDLEKAFDPSEPRDEQGQWTDGGGIAGLTGVNLSGRSFEQARNALKRGGYDMRVVNERTSWGGAKTQVVAVQPNDIPADWAAKDSRMGDGLKVYYDPAYAKMVDGELTINDRNLGRPTGGEPGLIYRGMSFEEYQQALSTGNLQSRGEYNIVPEQAGTTIYTRDPQTAASYASGFAPWEYMPTPTRPGVVVAIKDPGNHAAGGAADEIGLRGGTPISAIDHVYLAHPIIVEPGTFDVVTYGGATKVGSSSAPSASVRWERVDGVAKVGPADEARDDHGRWTDAGGADLGTANQGALDKTLTAAGWRRAGAGDHSKVLDSARRAIEPGPLYPGERTPHHYVHEDHPGEVVSTFGSDFHRTPSGQDVPIKDAETWQHRVLVGAAGSDNYTNSLRYGGVALRNGKTPDELAAHLKAPDVTLFKYDESEARDDHGRWTSGGVPIFHGTTDAAVGNILREGVQPQPDKRNWGDPGFYAGDRAHSVFVSTDLQRAQTFARSAWVRNGAYEDGGDNLHAAVVEASVPKDEWAKFKQDELTTYGSSYFYGPPIKPEWIKRVGVIDNPDNADSAIKWTKVNKADDGGDVTVYCAIIIGGDLKKFDPAEARDEDGKWTNGSWTGNPSDKITVYRASANHPDGGDWGKGTYFAPTAHLARYYAESHYDGEPSDITVRQVDLPRGKLFREPSTRNFRLTEPHPVGGVTLKYSPDQPRAPAGSSDGGQWTAGGGLGIPVAVGIDAAKAQRAEWAKSATHQTEQAIIEHAPANQAVLGAAGRDVAAETGAEFKDPGVKTKDEKGIARFFAKVAAGRDPANVIDIVRGGFLVSSPQQAKAVIAGLAKRFPTIDEGWRMNEYGYFDRSAIVRFPDGMMGEVQMMTPELALAKSSHGAGAGGGHALYDVARALPEGDPTKIALTNKMKDLYGGTFNRLGPAWKSELGSIATAAGH